MKTLEEIQGICIKCASIIDKSRVITDKPTARIYCRKCITSKKSKG